MALSICLSRRRLTIENNHIEHSIRYYMSEYHPERHAHFQDHAFYFFVCFIETYTKYTE